MQKSTLIQITRPNKLVSTARLNIFLAVGIDDFVFAKPVIIKNNDPNKHNRIKVMNNGPPSIKILVAMDWLNKALLVIVSVYIVINLVKHRQT
jgi:hypothetical protein